ncbi:hypothetical protein F5X99DRAFT_10342 [Biscogniauxia marginata]|nr:hypothetical protein F5X99DRAFT_10342 [Biscogniauxia marginata]
MYGVAPAPAVSAPFYVSTSTPSKSACGRPRRKTTTSFAPFRDETRLVSLRYDQTVAAEPPIPIPPPRSPLRPPPPPSPRPFSWGTAQPTRTPVVVPPPRPPPPTEQHPALRTITSPRTVEDVLKRDSILAPTTSSHSHTFFDDDSDDDDDDDPFAYEKIHRITQVQPLQLKTRSVSPSIYSEHEHQARVSESNNSGVSEPLSSPGLTDGNTIASVPPATPPPQSTASHRSHKRFMRAFSFRSNSMRRLRKKSQQGEEEGEGAPQSEALMPMGETPVRPESPLSSLKLRPAPNPDPHSATGSAAAAAATGRLSPSCHPDSSPIISTTIPTESLLEDGFMSQLSFSKRGSIILGGKRPPKTKMAAKLNENNAEQIKEARAFPLVPRATKPTKPSHPLPSRRDDRGDSNDNNNPSQPKLKPAPKLEPAPPSAPTPTPTSRPPPPSIRLISEELEKESQKPSPTPAWTPYSSNLGFYFVATR